MIIELIQASPKISISLIATLVSFAMVLVYKYTTNQERMKEIKNLNKQYQEEMKLHKGNPEKMMEIQKKVMESSMEMMKSSFVPMLITMLPLFVLIVWLRNIYAATEIAKSWIWYYIVFGLVTNTLFRKIFKVH
jgi:uncharacterized membrane protein (DUF106 family)